MDPNNLQNTLNNLGGAGNPNFSGAVPPTQNFGQNLMGQNAAAAAATAGQYNPMLLQQNAYLNFPAFNMNYGNMNNSLLDFQQQQQQQYLMQHMHQPQLQQPQPQQQQSFQQYNPQMIQQQLQFFQQQQQMNQLEQLFQSPELVSRVQQQQQQQQSQLQQPSVHQVPVQQIHPIAQPIPQSVVQPTQPQQHQQIAQPVPQKVQMQNPQHQRLYEEQCRQMEREKQRAAELKAQMEAQEQARIREEMERKEREMVELRRKQEEEARRLEEQRKKEEAERIEREELMRFAEEERRKTDEARRMRSEMEEKHSQICQPLTLVATHFLPNFFKMIPYPFEGMSDSSLQKVSNLEEDAAFLNQADKATVACISDILSSVDVDDITTRMDKLCPNSQENNDLFLGQLPPLIQEVVSYNSSALDVDSHNNMELLDNEDLMMQEDITKSMPSEKNLPSAPSYVSAQTNHESTSYQQPKPVEEVRKVIECEPMTAEKIKLMKSIGKGPKNSSSGSRKKRDEVVALLDELTDNFVPSDGKRGRRRGRGENSDDDDEDELLKRDLKLIAAMESGKTLPSSVTGFPDEEMEHNKFFDKKSAKKRRKDDDRPPTPTDVISARDAEWMERQRQKTEMQKKRKVDDGSQEWNTDAMAENDSFIRFNAVLDTIFEQVENFDFSTLSPKKKKQQQKENEHHHQQQHQEEEENEEEEEDDDVSPELLIERGAMDELRREAFKLKSWQKLHKVHVDKLVKIVTMLERNMRDVISADNMRLLVPYDEEMEEEELAFKEAVEERLIKAIDAASTALIVMSSHKMHKQVLLEDTIERAVGLVKLYLMHIVYPASDSLFKGIVGKKKAAAEETKRRRRTGGVNKRSHAIQLIYLRIADCYGCFAELVRLETIPDSAIHHMASMSVSSFFVANVGELQIQSMRLASNIFSRGDEQIRYSMINDVLSSLHRIPSSTVKNVNNGYRLGNDLWISNTTALIMQLIQSIIKIPKIKKHNEDEEENGKRRVNQDAVVKDSFASAVKVINVFLAGFLAKCSQKGSKLDGEEDYRNLFSQFLQELLMSLYQPEWPVAEMILTSLGSLLVKHFRSKSTDITIRQASLDYLGLITARLRKDVKTAVDDSSERLELVVKTVIYEEDDDDVYDSVDDVDLSNLSTTDKLKKLEQALIDFIIERKGDSDVSVEYAVMFYAGEWYKETAEDLEIAKQKHSDALAKPDLTEKERRKLEKKRDRIFEKGATMKEFLMKMVDRRAMRKRAETVRSRGGNVMLEADALWAVKYLAQSREFSHSFEIYLKHIVFGAGSETVVNLRTRALKCLSMIIEADHEVLILDEVRKAVHSRMMDSHAQVREAAIELLGKFVLVKESYVQQYYSMIVERILDSGVAVRKRIIRIMREICDRFPNFEKIPEMLSKMVRRVNDEEGVKKLVHETFSGLWFQPIDERVQNFALVTKVMVMSSVVQFCIADATVEYLEQLVHTILKTGEKSVLFASKQIVDNLVDSILHLETKMANEEGANEQQEDNELRLAAKQKENQEKLLACLTTLAIFSKVRPELMIRHAETLQPYLSSTNVRTASENAMMTEVIGMLERVVPLMSHPSDQFLSGIDEDLAKMASMSGMQLVVSATACSSAIWNRFKKGTPKLAEAFKKFSGTLDVHIKNYQRDSNYKPDPRSSALLQRGIFSVGVLCRYFDFDEIFAGDIGDQIKSKTIVRDRIFGMLEFFSRSQNSTIRQKALIAIGHFCAQWSEYLTRKEVQNMYLVILNGRITKQEDMILKIQVLKNLEMFLQSEEKKLIKSHEDWETNKDNENLKEMELSGSGLSSTVIQLYWKQALNAYFDADVNVRNAAVQVTWLTLSQGLVTPGASIATLIAMTTDPIDSTRNRIENLLKEIDSKYAGMVQSKAVSGVRVSFLLHQRIRQAAVRAGHTQNMVVRGIRFCDFSAATSTAHSGNRGPYAIPRMSNDGMALLSGLYQSLRTNRQQRRSFLQAILKLFSDDSRDKLTLEEWIFVADNVAMFPYQMMDEPLYVIRLIDQIVAQTGQSIINQFKQALRPIASPYEQQQILEDEDTIFDPENLFARFPQNKAVLYELMVSSQSCFILLYMRNYLMKMYSFTDAKVQEYSPSEAAKVYEKACTRKNVQIFMPATALEELTPEMIAERNTMKGDYELAQKISRFRKMLLALDKGDENDDYEGGQIVRAAQNDDYDDEEEEEEMEEEEETTTPAKKADMTMLDDE